MKLHRDLGISQKSAWHLAHRIRKVFESGRVTSGRMLGPVEVDEAYFGGKERNKHRAKRNPGRGPSGKTIVAGVKDQLTNEIAAKVVPDTSKDSLLTHLYEHASPGARVYSDEAAAYRVLPRHEAVSHSVGEYVRDQAHINGMESFWGMVKRGYHGTYHKMSPKHLDRYVDEFAGRHNIRWADTLWQMEFVAMRMLGRQLTYDQLIEPNGLPAGAR